MCRTVERVAYAGFAVGDVGWRKDVKSSDHSTTLGVDGGCSSCFLIMRFSSDGRKRWPAWSNVSNRCRSIVKIPLK